MSDLSEPLITVKQLGDWLGLPARSVYVFLWDNPDFPRYRIGKRRLRFDRAEVQTWLDAHKAEAKP